MTAVWTAPRTWANNELVDANIMNQHLRDNLEWLKGLSVASQIPSANATITSTTFVDVWSPLTITSVGGGFIFGACFQCSNNNNLATNAFDVMVDGVSEGGSSGVAAFSQPGAGGNGVIVTILRYIAPKAAGSHTFKLRALVSAGTTLTIYGTVSNVSPQLWVREI